MDLIATLNAGAGTYAGWQVYLSGSGGNYLSFALFNTIGSNGLNLQFSSTPTNGSAYQFCVSTDGTGTAAGVLAYVNGASVAQHTVLQNNLTGSAASTINASIGYRSGSGNNFLDGGTADYRIFNYALSSAQVAALYASGVK